MEKTELHDDDKSIEYDPCVNCGEPSPYPIWLNIDHRNFYIEGSGQLCIDCWRKIYGK